MAFLDWFKEKNPLKAKFKQELAIERKVLKQFNALKRETISFFGVFRRNFSHRDQKDTWALDSDDVSAMKQRIDNIEQEILKLHSLIEALKTLAAQIETYLTKSRPTTKIKLTHLEQQTVAYIKSIEEELSKLQTLTQQMAEIDWKKFRSKNTSAPIGMTVEAFERGIIGKYIQNAKTMKSYEDQYKDLYKQMQNHLFNLFLLGKKILKTNDFSA